MIRRALLIILLLTAFGLHPIPSGFSLPEMRATPASRVSGYGVISSRSVQWSMLQNGPRRLGRTTTVGAQSSNLAWRFPTETNYGGPVIGADGTIYQGTLFGQFLAFRPDGTIKWSIRVPGTVEMTPAIMRDGRIAFVNSAGTLYVVNPDGSPSWHFRTDAPTCLCFEPSPAVGRDGTVYFALWDTVYAVSSDGSLLWTFYTGGWRVGGPVAVRPDGVVYLPAQYLFAINPDGTLRWQSADLFGPGGAPVIADDGTIYVNSFQPPTLYAFFPEGAKKWMYKVADCCTPDVPSTPAIGRDGTVYLGALIQSIPTTEGVALALNPDGTLKWEAHYGGSPTAMALGGDGTVYYGSGSHNGPASVYALNPDGSLKWQYDDPYGGYVRTPPAIGKGQRVYAGGFGDFFAIGP